MSDPQDLPDTNLDNDQSTQGPIDILIEQWARSHNADVLSITHDLEPSSEDRLYEGDYLSNPLAFRGLGCEGLTERQMRILGEQVIQIIHNGEDIDTFISKKPERQILALGMVGEDTSQANLILEDDPDYYFKKGIDKTIMLEAKRYLINTGRDLYTQIVEMTLDMCEEGLPNEALQLSTITSGTTKNLPDSSNSEMAKLALETYVASPGGLAKDLVGKQALREANSGLEHIVSPLDYSHYIKGYLDFHIISAAIERGEVDKLAIPLMYQDEVWRVKYAQAYGLPNNPAEIWRHLIAINTRVLSATEMRIGLNTAQVAIPKFFAEKGINLGERYQQFLSADPLGNEADEDA